jgi:hypothetical protein
MPVPTHVLLKWNADREPRTIERHREIAEQRASVWWGRFAQPGGPGVSADRITELRAQIESGIPTLVFRYHRGDAWQTRLHEVTADPQVVDEERLPTYYTKAECNAFFRIGDFEHLQGDWVVKNLRLANPSAGPLAGALGNQTTPLFVQAIGPSALSAPPITGPTIWCVRAGHDLVALDRFLKASVVALGWDEVGDPRRFGADTGALSAEIAKHYPADHLPSAVGVFRRFLTEIHVADLVITPGDESIHIGRITGEPSYAGEAERFRTNRPVEWITSVPRASLSVEAKNALSPQLTCFEVKGAREELLALATIGATAPVATFLLTWSAEKAEAWPDYEEAIRAAAEGRPARGRWSVGSRTGGIHLGDRAFLMRQRLERGIVASGRFVSGEVVQDDHWDGSDRDANYTDVEWDTVLPVERRLPIELLEERIPGAHWTPQGSGTQLLPVAASHLETLWAEHLAQLKKTASREQRTWWVNQNQTYPQERAGNYIWAPKESKGGGSAPRHWDLTRLRPGDRIFHYSGQTIRAVSTVIRSVAEAQQPADFPDDRWERAGYRVDTQYRDLVRPISRHDIPVEWRIAEGKRSDEQPFNVNGDAKQGYLWRLTPGFVEQLVARYPELEGNVVVADDFEQQWRALCDYLAAQPLWQTLAENVDVFDVKVADERIDFRTNESKDVRTITRGEFETRYRQLKQDGQLPRVWDTAKMACLALLPNVEYSINPLTLYWVDPPSHEIGEIRQHALVAAPSKPLGMSWLEEQTLWKSSELEELAESIRSKSFQVVLAGPPGTGKTWVAKHLSKYLTQDPKQVFRTVQFHPSYSYEEFIEGLRPEANEDGVIRFEHFPGVILRMVRDVGTDPGPHILLIDEMNRANLPKVFGELMYLFEYRDEEIDLRYRTNFRLPSSLRFVATMNTADRSIRSIDTALRRRFDVVECPPRRDVLERYYAKPGRTNEVTRLFDGFERLNHELTAKLDRHHTVGHTFFMAPRMTTAELDRVWKHKIGPLIEEYFFDQPDLAAEFSREQLWP